MKKIILALILLISTFTQASKRVTLRCDFDAVAEGYSNASYAVNMVLEGRFLYNQNGSEGKYLNRPLYADDGNIYINTNGEYVELYNYEGKDLPVNVRKDWSLSTGNVVCILREGWIENRNYSKPHQVVHDTVVKVEKIAPSWASCVNVLPHYTDTVRVLRVDTVVVHDTIRVEF